MSNARALKGACASAWMRKARLVLKGGMLTNLYYRPIGTTDNLIIPIVLATLDVLIERANLGAILCRRKSSLLLGSKLEKPFSQLSVPLNLSQLPRLNVVIHLLILLIVFCGIDFNYSFTTKVTN